MAQVLGGEVNRFGIGRPRERSYPVIEIRSEVVLLAGFAIVEHEAEAVALVTGTLLGAVGDVAAVGGIEGGGIAGRVVGGDVLGRPSANREDPEIVVGGSGWILLVI